MNGASLHEGEELLSKFEDHALKYASHSLNHLYVLFVRQSLSITHILNCFDLCACVFRKRSDGQSTAGGSAGGVFAVQSLGWVEIAEEDLTRERSSKAVNKCIVDLSRGARRDFNDAVGCWGDVRHSGAPSKPLFFSISDRHYNSSSFRAKICT